MTTMISKTLLTNGAWTEIAVGPIANILLVGPSSGWAVFVAATAPGVGDAGMPVTAIDGAWSSSVLGSNESVFARPFGQFADRAVSVSGMKN